MASSFIKEFLLFNTADVVFVGISICLFAWLILFICKLLRKFAPVAFSTTFLCCICSRIELWFELKADIAFYQIWKIYTNDGQFGVANFYYEKKN